VSASNECFTSEAADAFTTTIYTSAGLNEIGAEKQLIIFPNPTDGKVTVKLPLQKAFTGDLTITDANGGIVMVKSNMNIPAGDAATLELGQLSKGVYTLKLSSNSASYFGRIIVK
jgi:hypothetical protein